MKIVTFILLLFLAGIAIAACWFYTPDKPISVLTAKYYIDHEAMVEVAGTRLRIVDSGPKSAPALIFLHGFGSSLETWQAWALQLQANYRVLRFDLPGSGLSAPDPTGDYSDARTFIILAALMDKLGIAKAKLIGNSLGGRIAWSFTAKNPLRVSKLVLISPDGFASPGFVYGQKAEVPAMMQLMPYFLPKSMVRANLIPAYGDPTKIRDALLTRYHDLMLAPGSRAALLARLQQTVLVDPVPILKKIQVPVLLMWGEKDGMIPVTNAEDYQKILPHSQLAILPGLGHTPFEEDPNASIVPLLTFLAQ